MACTVVKLGSSIVADDRGEVRTENLESICDQLAQLHRAGRSLIVVTSGAIARGMGVMSLPLRPRAMDELQAASAVGQGRLYRVYDELLSARGVPTAQVLLTFFDISARTHYLNARQTLRKLLEWRVVPVINENDTTTTDEISFGNNDFLAAQVAILLGAELLLLLTDAEGVYTANPRTDPAAPWCPKSPSSMSCKGSTSAPAPRPWARAECARRWWRPRWRRRPGFPPSWASGLQAGTILAAARAAPPAPGSPLARAATRASSCGSSTPSRPAGRVLVDAGAARALREGGTSLLPVGDRRRQRALRGRRRRRGGVRRADGGERDLQLLGRMSYARSRV